MDENELARRITGRKQKGVKSTERPKLRWMGGTRARVNIESKNSIGIQSHGGRSLGSQGSKMIILMIPIFSRSGYMFCPP